ncbi:MAG TPA: signal peptidase I [Thermoanaerobaculia bacterium]|jgi:signal peptidase I|nr:signal peptidase I [Thermoanaerobaculia bacterium]
MSNETTPKPVVREYLEALLIAVIFATFARTFVFQAFKIPSGSMEENLLIGDHILVNKFIYGPRPSALERALLPFRDVRRGDVVVFRWPVDPSRDFIKRAVGLPGDVVKLVDKHLYVNGKLVGDEGYTYHSDPVTYPRGPAQGPGHSRDNFGPVRVPPDSYFCLGDNRDNSHDSRFWGVVPASHLKGRAFVVYWSFEEDPSDATDGPGWRGRLRQIAQVALHFFSHTRWERTFRIVR